MRGEPVRVVGDVVFSPSYAPHVARVIRELIDAGASGIQHAAGGGACSWYEFARYAFERMGLGPVERVASAPSARAAPGVLRARQHDGGGARRRTGACVGGRGRCVSDPARGAGRRGVVGSRVAIQVRETIFAEAKLLRPRRVRGRPRVFQRELERAEVRGAGARRALAAGLSVVVVARRPARDALRLPDGEAGAVPARPDLRCDRRCAARLAHVSALAELRAERGQSPSALRSGRVRLTASWRSRTMSSCTTRTACRSMRRKRAPCRGAIPASGSRGRCDGEPRLSAKDAAVPLDALP